MLGPSAAAAALMSAPGATDSGSASGVISILIGVAIIVAAFRWAFIARRAGRTSTPETPAPPVRRLGADVEWWRENAGTGAASAVDSAGPDLTKPPTRPDQSSTN